MDVSNSSSTDDLVILDSLIATDISLISLLETYVVIILLDNFVVIVWFK